MRSRGLVHTVRGTSGHVSDVIEDNGLLHGEERVVFADAGYQGVDKRPDAKAEVTWHVALGPVRAKVEHPFRVIKRQFGYVKVLYRGLAKNTAQLVTLFALANLWRVRRKLMGA